MQRDNKAIIPLRIEDFLEGKAVMKYNRVFNYFYYFTMDCPQL